MKKSLFLFGTLLGALTTFAITSEAGKKAQKDIRKKSQKSLKIAKKNVSKMAKNSQKQFKKSTEQAEELLHKTKSKLSK